MIDMMLDFVLGPFRSVGDFYFEHQMLLNSLVVGVAILKLFTKKKSRQNESAS